MIERNQVEFYHGFDEHAPGPHGKIHVVGGYPEFNYPKERFFPKDTEGNKIGYKIYDLTLINSEAGAAAFTLEPGVATRIVRVNSPDYWAFHTQTTFGSGYAIEYNLNLNRVRVTRLEKNASVAHGYIISEGDVACIIADKCDNSNITVGLSYVEISSRPYNPGDVEKDIPGDEEFVPVDDPSLPTAFWDEYHRLLGR